MDELKLSFMTSLLKSSYHKWMSYYILAFAFSVASIPVEMEDPFTRMSYIFFSFLSQIKQRGYVIATTQALSFSFFPPISTSVCVYAALSFLSFLITHRSFPIYPHLCNSIVVKPSQ